jgi:serine/threonine protein kinase
VRHFAKERALLRKRRIKLDLSDFHTIIKVGEGAYGEVFLAKKKDTGEICAVKKIDKKMIFLKENVSDLEVLWCQFLVSIFSLTRFRRWTKSKQRDL